MEQLTKQVRRAQRWLGLERFVGMLGWCWFAALLIAAVLITVDKFWPLGVEAWVWLVGAVGVGGLAAAGWAILRGRGPIDAAIEIDHRFGLKERVSSTLAMSEEERGSEVGKALVDDAIRRVGNVDINEQFNVSPGRQMLLPLLPLAAGLLVAWLVNPAALDNKAQADTSEAVKKQVEASAENLRRKLVEQRKKAEEQGLKDAQQLFERLEEGIEDMAGKTEGDRKKALVELRDLARQLEKRRDQLGGAEQVQKQLEQLRNLARGPADKFMNEIGRGNFEKAMRELENLKAQVASGNLSDAEREQLAKQLDEMKDKLQEMIDAHQDAMEDIERRIDQARKAGNEDQAANLQDQLDQLRQQMPQMNQLDNLANQLGQCAESLQNGDLQDAGGLLDQMQGDLENLQQQLNEMKMLDEAMDQLAQARQQMNCPVCGGAGCDACEIPGMGLGAGRGQGDRPEAEDEVGFFDTKTPQQLGAGSATIVGEVAGPNIKGNVAQEIKEQYESARREATDPLTGQQLPRQHRKHAQEYFDSFRQGQ